MENEEQKEPEHVQEKTEKKENELVEKKEKEHSEKKNKSDVVEKIRENPFIASTLVLGVLVLVLIFFSFSGGNMTGNVVSEGDIGQQLLSFYELNGAQGLELDSVDEVSGVYQVNFKYQGMVVPIYATKDGKFAGSLSPLVASNNQDNSQPTQKQTPQDIPKSNKPKVELFVMTYCPYGTQAEKGIIPTLKALGNVIDGKIRFVHYFMHGDDEETETYTQVCIREEQSLKYLDYLECFLEDGDSERCLTETGINQVKLDTCVETKAEEYYAEDSELSEGYGVKGSPTLIINGVIANSGRDSASFLDVICSAFNTPPGVCETAELSSQPPSTGFGGGTASAGSNAQAQC